MVEITYMVPDFLVRDYEAPITDVNDPGTYMLYVCYHSSHF